MGASLSLILIYMVAVGWNGNAAKMLSQMGKDTPGFAPFIASVIALMLLNNTKAKPLVAPFITLAVLTTILNNWVKVQTELKTTYDVLGGKQTLGE